MRGIKLLIILICSLLGLTASAQYVQPMGYKDYSFYEQLNIGNKAAKTTAPSAFLELGKATGSLRGFLLPRGNKDSVASPVKGLLFYDLGTNTTVQYNGTSWVNFGAPSLGYGNIWADDAITVDTSAIGSKTWTQNYVAAAIAASPIGYTAGYGINIFGSLIKADTSVLANRNWTNTQISTAIAGISASIPDFSAYSLIGHTHTSSEITNFTVAVRNLLHAGSGVDYDASTGTFSIPGTGFIGSLNGLTAGVQTFATGTSGTDFNISSIGTAHTFNFPSSSASNRGLLTSTDWSTFNSKVSTSQLADSTATLRAIRKVDSIYRTPGKDSIQFVINGLYHAIKDSTGGGGGSGTVTSVGLSMPSAFTVSSSPVTTSGTIAVSGAGTTAQYIRGDGTLATYAGVSGLTSGRIPVASSSTTLTDYSGLTYNGSTLNLTGSGTGFSFLSSGGLWGFQFSNNSGQPRIDFISNGDYTGGIKSNASHNVMVANNYAGASLVWQTKETINTWAKMQIFANGNVKIDNPGADTLTDSGYKFDVHGTTRTSSVAQFDSTISGKEQSVDPSTPSSGYRLLYPKSDGWYEKSSAGTVTKLAGGGGGATGLGSAIERTKVVENPTSAENITCFYTDVAITISKASYMLIGTGSPSLTFQINHSTDRSSGSPNTLFSSSKTITTYITTSETSFNDATIPAGSWVWLTTSAKSGVTVTEFAISFKYTVD